MDDILKTIGDIVPPKWRLTLTVLVLLSPYIGRAIQSIRLNGGVKGLAASIWLGTNVSKDIALKTQATADRLDKTTQAVMSGDTSLLTKPQTDLAQQTKQ